MALLVIPSTGLLPAERVRLYDDSFQVACLGFREGWEWSSSRHPPLTTLYISSVCSPTRQISESSHTLLERAVAFKNGVAPDSPKKLTRGADASPTHGSPAALRTPHLAFFFLTRGADASPTQGFPAAVRTPHLAFFSWPAFVIRLRMGLLAGFHGVLLDFPHRIAPCRGTADMRGRTSCRLVTHAALSS